MRAFKTALPAAVLMIYLLAAPAAGLASPLTWDDELAAHPDHTITDFTMDLNVTAAITWENVVAQLGATAPVNVLIFAAEGIQINFLTDHLPIATGQHVSVALRDDPRAVNLMQVIIRGDVTGSGRLNIAQLVRLAGALNGTRPLDGLYALAGDVNGSGSLNIADLTQLASWLRAA
ncbi:MAG: hypothetical protein HDQ87_04555 [Clostridia bacterium]|nr:hypothetical protein [Clostridia bacterium]